MWEQSPGVKLYTVTLINLKERGKFLMSGWKLAHLNFLSEVVNQKKNVRFFGEIARLEITGVRNSRCVISDRRLSS